jgi:hypothetical protein
MHFRRVRPWQAAVATDPGAKISVAVTTDFESYEAEERFRETAQRAQGWVEMLLQDRAGTEIAWHWVNKTTMRLTVAVPSLDREFSGLFLDRESTEAIAAEDPSVKPRILRQLPGWLRA